MSVKIIFDHRSELARGDPITDFFRRHTTMRHGLAHRQFADVAQMIEGRPSDARNLVMLLGSGNQAVRVNSRKMLDLILTVEPRTEPQKERFRQTFLSLNEGMYDERCGAACVELLEGQLGGENREAVLAMFKLALSDAPARTKREILYALEKDAAEHGLTETLFTTIQCMMGERDPELIQMASRTIHIHYTWVEQKS